MRILLTSKNMFTIPGGGGGIKKKYTKQFCCVFVCVTINEKQ